MFFPHGKYFRALNNHSMSNTIFSRLKATLGISLFAVILLTQSCKKADVQKDEPTVSAERIETLRSSVAASTGAPLSAVQYNAANKSFIVASDAMISLEDALKRFPETTDVKPSSAGSDQRVYTYTVSRTNASNIAFYVDGTVPSAWISALDQAIANWNSTNSLVFMKRETSGTTTTATGGNGKGKKGGTTTTTTTTPTYNVLVTTTYDANTSMIAQAYYPEYTGTAGKQVTINTYYNSLSTAQKIFAMTHELGHTIGLTHTDQTYGNLIPGTPEVDANSVMNSFVLSWVGFTPYDITAVTTVYPK
jgi:hypothetical protein